MSLALTHRKSISLWLPVCIHMCVYVWVWASGFFSTSVFMKQTTFHDYKKTPKPFKCTKREQERMPNAHMYERCTNIIVWLCDFLAQLWIKYIHAVHAVFFSSSFCRFTRLLLFHLISGLIKIVLKLIDTSSLLVLSVWTSVWFDDCFYFIWFNFIFEN